MAEAFTSPALRQAFRGGRLKYDQAIYYRRPSATRNGRPVEEAGWLVTGSFTHRVHYEERGFEPLYPKFGFLPQDDPELLDIDGAKAPLRSKWYPILSHPEGPKEFPLDQVLSNRWFEMQGLENVFGYGSAPDPASLFPQLRNSGTITKYRCPDCAEPKREFIDPSGQSALGKHLRIVHDWNRTELDSWGAKYGIDFKEVYGDPRSKVVVTTSSPTAEQLACDDCDYVVPADSKKPDAALRMHKMSAHKPVAVETIG